MNRWQVTCIIIASATSAFLSAVHHFPALNKSQEIPQTIIPRGMIDASFIKANSAWYLVYGARSMKIQQLQVLGA